MTHILTPVISNPHNRAGRASIPKKRTVIRIPCIQEGASLNDMDCSRKGEALPAVNRDSENVKGFDINHMRNYERASLL